MALNGLKFARVTSPRAAEDTNDAFFASKRGQIHFSAEERKRGGERGAKIVSRAAVLSAL